MLPEFRLPPTATSVLFGVASLAVFVLFAVVEAGGEMPAVTAVEPRECLEGYEPKGQRPDLDALTSRPQHYPGMPDLAPQHWFVDWTRHSRAEDCRCRAHLLRWFVGADKLGIRLGSISAKEARVERV